MTRAPRSRAQNAAPPALRRAWARLVEPAAEVVEAAKRRNARLLSALLLVLIPVAFVGTFASALLDPGDVIIPTLSLGSMIALGIAYAVSRTRHVALAGTATVVVVMAGEWVSILDSGTDLAAALALVYLVLSVGLAAVLLPVAVGVAVAALNLTGAALFVGLSSQLSLADAAPALIFLAAAAPLLLVGAAVRTRQYSEIERQTDELLKHREHLSQLVGAAQQVERELRASEERYRELFENANDVVFSHDLEGRLTAINRAGERISGYSRDEILGRQINNFVAPEFLPIVEEETRRKLAGDVEMTAYEIDALAKDGRRVPLEVSTRLIYDGGAPVGVQGIARDVSERRALEEQLRQAQKLEAVGRLAGGVAHDFNNLLTAIGGYCDLLLLDLDGSDAHRHDVEQVKAAADRATRLTGQLLAFSRRQVLQPRVLDLGSVIAGMEPLLRRLLGENVELVIARDGELASVKADPGQLEQVLMNLAVNARDAMPDGGRLTIDTGTTELRDPAPLLAAGLEPGAYIRLDVVDTGIGMDEETRSHVFEPFFTTKASGEGTGLGLATVYGIVSQSGGAISVESELGAGTTFRILLPAVEEQAAVEARISSGHPVEGSETTLLVEDEDVVRSLARAVLERHGYHVLEARNGHEAEALSDGYEGTIHLLLTDVVMPGMDGRTLAELLLARRPSLRVLYTSGYTDDAIGRHGVLEPGTAFLPKPFGPETLARMVRDVLDGG